MKKFFMAIALTMCATVAMAQQTKKISQFQNEDIYGLIADGAFDIRISQGSETGVHIEILDEHADKLSVSKTEQGYIRVGYGSSVGRYFKGKNKPFVTVVVKELRFLRLDGACTAIGKGEYSASELSEIILAGSSSLDFINVSAPNVVFDITGGKTSDITVSTDDLKINISGTSRASIDGTAKTSKITSSGASSLEILALKCPKIEAVVSGMSGVKALVEGEAQVTRTGTASFRYTGSGKITGDAKPIK